MSSTATKGADDATTGRWTVGDVANGDTQRLTIRTRIQASAVGTEIANHAAVVLAPVGVVAVLASRERRGHRRAP